MPISMEIMFSNFTTGRVELGNQDSFYVFFFLRSLISWIQWDQLISNDILTQLLHSLFMVYIETLLPSGFSIQAHTHTQTYSTSQHLLWCPALFFFFFSSCTPPVAHLSSCHHWHWKWVHQGHTDTHTHSCKLALLALPDWPSRGPDARDLPAPPKCRVIVIKAWLAAPVINSNLGHICGAVGRGQAAVGARRTPRGG